MISLINYDFQWGRSEVVIIYPDWSQTELLTVQDASRPTPGYPGIHPDLSARIVAHDGRPQAERRHGRCHGVRAMKFSLFPGKSGEHELKSMEKWSFASQLVFFSIDHGNRDLNNFHRMSMIDFPGNMKTCFFPKKINCFGKLSQFCDGLFSDHRHGSADFWSEQWHKFDFEIIWICL